MTSYDAIVIGTGQAGPSLAHRLASAGKKVAIAERKRFGGTCVNNGCIPTKAMVASARAAWVARRAVDWGIRIDGPVSADMAKVKARKDAIVRPSTEGVEKGLRQNPNCIVYHSHARFEAPNQVRVGDDLISAPLVFMNVGARASVPPIPGLESVPSLNNSSMMGVDFLPEHLVILGGSYIGCEFAQMFRRFGSEVTVIERSPHLMSREDDDVCEAIEEIFASEGVRVLTNASILRVSAPATVETTKGPVRGSHLLLALGRIPNTRDLGLEKAGIATDPRGYILVNDKLETNVPGHYALGDCNGRGAFTHTSYNDFEIVAANLLDGDNRGVSDRITAYNVYIDPPLGRAGMNERDVRASGRPALIGTRPMTKVGRAFERGETKGFLKVLVDRETKMILGASLIGIECDEVIHCLLDVMYAKAPYTVISRAMHIHPTVSELIPTVLQDLRPFQ